MRRVLIANRGEIAFRIVRACRSLGLESVAVYSEADRASPHVWAADRAVRIGPAAPERSYLDANALLHVARACGCDAIHPGYGFLAENHEFAARCIGEGLVFVGPSPETIGLMGDKAAARRCAARLGVPVAPGSEAAFADAAHAAEAAVGIGFPVLLKARAGGGGRGMRVADSAEAFEGLFLQAKAEAAAAFGDGAIYLERYIPRVRHVEVQVFGDSHGNLRHLWERDCTVQRRHQKLIEEAFSPALGPGTRKQICEAAEALARGVGYVGAGTVEFIYDLDNGGYYFIEMNTRIQVEHPVTEVLTGIDLVAEQLRVAAGHELSFARNGAPRADGHVIEFRINAEDADNDFMPAPGRLSRWRPPSGAGLRLDSHVYEGYAVSPYYDPLLGKLIVRGADRVEAMARARAALTDFEVEGIATTVPFHLRMLNHPDFVESRVHTRWIEEQTSAKARHG
ncbi:MAG: acetyl/propionyl/methylcrotonyl-CoA carboxylase subunit alpha [Kiloniellaceae bacterium]